VLVHLGADGRAHLPGLAVIVGVDGIGAHLLAVLAVAEEARVLLDEAALVLPVAHLDAGAGGGEHGAAVLGLRDLGHRAVLPGQARVVDDGEVRTGDHALFVVIAVHAVPDPSVLRVDAEQEDRAGLAVHHIGGIGVAGLLAGD